MSVSDALKQLEGQNKNMMAYFCSQHIRDDNKPALFNKKNNVKTKKFPNGKYEGHSNLFLFKLK